MFSIVHNMTYQFFKTMITILYVLHILEFSLITFKVKVRKVVKIGIA
jgi:hypothetical protein